MEAADLEIFADGHNLLRNDLRDLQLRAGILAVHDGLDGSGVLGQNDLADVLDELDKRSGLRAEVGLAVDLDHRAHAALLADSRIRHAFGSDAAGLLGSLRQTLFTEPFDSLIHIAVGLGQGLLAVHHADIGHFTQFLDISSSKCHCNFLQFRLSFEKRPSCGGRL